MLGAVLTTIPVADKTGAGLIPAEVSKYDLKTLLLYSCETIQVSVPLQCLVPASFSQVEA
jgi:hypothetical protein